MDRDMLLKFAPKENDSKEDTARKLKVLFQYIFDKLDYLEETVIHKLPRGCHKD